MAENNYLKLVIDRLLEHVKSGDVDGLQGFVKDKLMESYKNGIARGKTEAQRKSNGTVK